MFFNVIAQRALFATSESPCACALSQDMRIVPAEVRPPSLCAMLRSSPLRLPIALLIQCRFVEEGMVVSKAIYYIFRLLEA